MGQNNANWCIEYLNDPALCKKRYVGMQEYEDTVAKIEEALNARVEQKVSSGKVKFSGFPANMGEAGLRSTLQAFGNVVSLSSEESDDYMTLEGQVEFEE